MIQSKELSETRTVLWPILSRACVLLWDAALSYLRTIILEVEKMITSEHRLGSIVKKRDVESRDFKVRPWKMTITFSWWSVLPLIIKRFSFLICETFFHVSLFTLSNVSPVLGFIVMYWLILNTRKIFIVKCYIGGTEIMFILLMFRIEVDYCLRDCAYVFVLDYLDYSNAP